ncbi:MAG: enoyl-CoA hydratase-related protein [Solirubrobacteraceae bacterium]
MSLPSTIRWDQSAEGVVTLTLDDPGQSANTMNAAYMASMHATVARLEAEREGITGVIVASAKKTFFAGGDLGELLAVTPEDGAEYAGRVEGAKADLRRLEALGVPVVSVIAGAALGGGLEIALATHHRIVVDDPKVQLGLPEVTLGLLPGGGGVTRTVRLLGVHGALSHILLDGPRFPPAAALEQGLVDELVGSADELIPAALRFIADHPGSTQPWDRDGYVLPGGVPAGADDVVDGLAISDASREALVGGNYPAPAAILAAAVEGARGTIDEALEIEGRHFMGLVTHQVAKNMIQSNFFDLQAVAGARGRPRDRARWTPGQIVIDEPGDAADDLAALLSGASIDVVVPVGPPAPSAPPGSVLAVTPSALLPHPAARGEATAVIGLRPAPGGLLEVVHDDHTPDEIVWRALDLARAVRRTPILIGAGHGFLVERLEASLLREADLLRTEGHTTHGILDALRDVGYTAAARDRIGARVQARQVGDAPATLRSVPADDVRDRLLFAPALEAVRCRDEGVVTLDADANVASLRAIGFPGWTGGVLQFVEAFRPRGAAPGALGSRTAFLRRARSLATDYGPRFTPPSVLVKAG